MKECAYKENGKCNTCAECMSCPENVVKTPRWSEERQAYICQHCGSEIDASLMTHGFYCKACGLPIHEDLRK